MLKKGSGKRFAILHKEEQMFEGAKIIVDKETGVHYLITWHGYSGGVTPLLDAEGKVVVKPYAECEEE